MGRVVDNIVTGVICVVATAVVAIVLDGDDPPAIDEPQIYEPDVEAQPRDWVWRYYRERYGAYFAYLTYGAEDPAIEVFVRNKAAFHPIESFVADKVTPRVDGDGWWASWRDQGFVWWGARTLLLSDAPGDETLLVFPYLSGGFGDASRKFATLVRLRDGEQKDIALEGRMVVGELSGAGEYTPTSVGAADLDGDGSPDFVIGSKLWRGRALSEIEMIDLDSLERVAGDSVLLDGRTPLLVERRGRRIALSGISAGAKREVSSIEPMPEAPSSLSPTDRSVLALHDLDGDDAQELVVKQDGTLLIYLSGEGYNGPPRRISGPDLERAHVGAVGDFDADGSRDFWIVVGGETPGVGVAYLMSGAALTGQSTTEDAICVLNDSAQYSDTGAFGATISPIAGDVDGDGRPDFSISGHFHLSWSGALYILFGRSIDKDCRHSIESPEVMRISGAPFSELAPTGLHYDHMDLNQDGYSDIVVTADNDLEAGFAAGALYVLDGKRIATKRSTGSSRRAFDPGRWSG